MIKEINNQKQLFFNSLVNNQIDNGDRVDKIAGLSKNIFLTSNGGFQTEYLSFYEILHDVRISELFSSELLLRLLEKVGKINLSVTKILAVTVSSQLIGVVIRDLINNDHRFQKIKNELKEEVELVRLSSYYSFDQEEPFKDLESGDRILVVNDVISSGNLVNDVCTKLISDMNCEISGILTIADCRNQNSSESLELINSIFLKDSLENKVISIVNETNGLKINKYKGPYIGNKGRLRVNPLLNTVVELKEKHSEIEKILFQNFRELLDKLNSEFFKIGHFEQGLTHNSFLINMREIYSSHEGVLLLKEVSERLTKSKDEKCLTEFAISHIEEMLSLQKDDALKDFGILKSTIRKIKQPRRRDFDFVFFPIFSGIERMKTTQIAEIFNVEVNNVVGLQRFETPKGWRFPFPPKYYNKLTSNKDILILDSGSLTGETLVQLIDSISILEVKSITVLSTIVRIEDFFREFYSRIRVSSVKVLGKEEDKGIKLADVNIYFGTYICIPAYLPTSKTCPFCMEINFLENVSNDHYNLPNESSITEYINFRLKEIKLVKNKEEINESWLPKDRVTNKIPVKKIFYKREEIGRVDSYRFFEDIFIPFDKIVKSIYEDKNWFQKNEIREDMELTLICILIEPQLVRLFANLLRNNYILLSEYVLDSISDSSKIWFFNWTAYQKTRICYTFLESLYLDRQITSFEEFYSTLFKIYDLAKIDKNATQFLYFKMYSFILKKPRKSSYYHRSNVEGFYNNQKYLKEIKSDFTSYIEKLIEEYHDNNKFESLKLCYSFSILKKYILKRTWDGGHFIWNIKINEILDLVNNIEQQIRYDEIKLKVGELVKEYDEFLFKPIKTILEIDRFDQYFHQLNSTFRSEENGFVSLIEKLRILDVKDTGELTKVVTGILSNFSEQTKLEPYELVSLAQEYPIEITDALRSNNIWDKVENQKFAPTYVEINSYFINEIFKEINNNCKKENGRNEIELLKIKDEIQFINIEILFKRPFKNNRDGHVGGGKYIIRNIVEGFCGLCTDNSDSIKENYRMNISFLKSLNNERKHNYSSGKQSN